MLKQKKIKVGKKYIDTLIVKLQSRNFILLRGSKGYVMCGYLNLKTAEKFKDVAVKIVGVSTIEETLKAKVYSCSSAARNLGITKGQSVKEILPRIA